MVTNFTARIHKLGPAPKWADVTPRYDMPFNAPEQRLEPIRPLGCGANPSLPELKESIKKALSDGLEGVLGWKSGFRPAACGTRVHADPGEVDQLIWGPFNVHNLANFLPQYKGRKIGVVVKGCDSKGVIELLAEKLIEKDDVTIFGMGCNGTADLNRVLEKLPEGVAIEAVNAPAIPSRSKPEDRNIRYPCWKRHRTSAVSVPTPMRCCPTCLSAPK